MGDGAHLLIGRLWHCGRATTLRI